MDLAQSRLSREIAPPWDRHASIDGDRELHQHRGPPALEARDKSGVEALGLVSEQALFDLDAGGAQTAYALSVGARIGVAHRDDDPGDPRLANRVDARRRPAMVRAWLEVRVEGGAPGILTCIAERVDLGVRLARSAVITLADDLAIANDDRADERIGTRPASGARGEAKRAAHVRALRFGHGC